MTCFLSKRIISVRVHGVFVEPLPVNPDVLQGSILVDSIYWWSGINLQPSSLFRRWWHWPLFPSSRYYLPTHNQHRSGTQCSQCITCFQPKTNIRLRPYQPSLLQCFQDFYLSFHASISHIPPSKLWLDFFPSQSVTFITGLVHKFFILLVFMCINACRSNCALSWLSVRRQTLLFSYVQCLHKLQMSSTFVYCNHMRGGASTITLFVNGLIERPLGWSMIPPWPLTVSYFPIVRQILNISAIVVTLVFVVEKMFR